MDRAALAPADVLRTADGARLQAALRAILAKDDAPVQLLDLLTDDRAVECSEVARGAAFGALMESSSAEAVVALHRLASMQHGRGLNLYDAARALPLRALLQHAGCATAGAIEAIEEDAGLVNVSDLVRYCSDGGGLSDADEHLAGLELETGGVLSRASLRAVVAEARNLCEATSRLSMVGGSSVESEYNTAVEEMAGQGDSSDALREEPRTRDVGC